MSVSGHDEDHRLEPMNALTSVLELLRLSETLAQGLVRYTRRSRQIDTALSEAVAGAARKMQRVYQLLADADAAREELPVVEVQAKQKAKRKRVRPRKEQPVSDDELDERVKRVEDPVIVERPAKKLQLADASLGEIDDGTLVFFSLTSERNGRLWKCAADNGEEVEIIRNGVNVVDFGALNENQRGWYLGQLESEILKRFRVNFPVLFRSYGVEMTTCREALLRDADLVTNLVDTLASRVDEVHVSAKQSPALNAANNTALMLAAMLHRRMSTSGEADWYLRWQAQVKDLCKRCQLSFTTMERYRRAGDLMMQSEVLMCLLPSFVMSLEEPLLALLGHQNAVVRLKAAFEEEVRIFSNSQRVLAIRDVEDAMAIEAPPVPDLPQPVAVEQPSSGICESPLGEPIDPIQQSTAAAGTKKTRTSGRRPAKCSICNAARVRCNASGCGYFCWSCNGYSREPSAAVQYPGTDEPIHLYMYCRKHIDKIELNTEAYERYKNRVGNNADVMTLPQFIQSVQLDEMEATIAIFSAPNCQFKVSPVAGDGWCIFRCVAKAVNLNLQEMISSFKDYVENNLSELDGVIVENESTFLEMIRSLDVDESDSVQELWSGGGGDILIAVLARYLNRKAAKAYQILDWHISAGELKRGHLAYPDDEGRYNTVINILLTNEVMPHYDLLVEK